MKGGENRKMSTLHCCTCPETDRSALKSTPRSLSREERREEQIRTALVSGKWHLHTVDLTTLRHCYRYLSQYLSLPYVAWYPEPTDEEGGYPCTVTKLIDPATGPGNKFDGIFCKVRIGKQESNLPLIELELSLDDPNCQCAEALPRLLLALAIGRLERGRPQRWWVVANRPTLARPCVTKRRTNDRQPTRTTVCSTPPY